MRSGSTFGRQARGRLLRAGELLARARGLPPAADRVHRLRARRAADGADAARRRVRLRRAAAARAAADHLGPAQPAGLATRARRSGSGITASRRRRRGQRAAGEDRHRDLPPQADRVRVPHDAERRDRAAQGRPVPPALRGRPVLPRRLLRTSARTCGSSGSRGSAARSPTRPRPSTTSSARTDFDPRGYANRIPWQLGDEVGVAEVEVPEDVAWYVERQFGAYGTLDGRRLPHRLRAPAAADLVGARASGCGSSARRALVEEARRRVDELIEAHRGEPPVAVASGLAPAPVAAPESNGRGRGAEAAIRPERFARLVTLASVLIAAGRAGERLQVADVCEQLKMSPQELREDVSVLNVVNFGGGAYVIYAEVLPSGEIEVDPEPYSDTFDRPARLLPIEAKALVAAIDLIGLAHADLRSAREKVVDALGFDPVEEGLHIVSPIVHDEHHAHRRARGAREPAARDRVLDPDRGPLLRARGRALRAVQRPRGLVRRGLGPRARPAAALPAGPHQARGGADGALRAARGPEPDRRHRRLAADRPDRRLARRRGC